MCIPGTRLSAWLPFLRSRSCLCATPQTKGRERGRRRGRLEKEASKQEPGKEMLLPVVAMLTRLIDRFDPQSWVLVPALRFPNRSRPRRRSRPRPLGRG
jgi:hypothetical protein